jgi:hypothetical protein
MPGGKVTVKHDLPDLESFLARKRYPLSKWLAANNISSPEAFKSLISSQKWIVSPELQCLAFELLKPVSEPVKETVLVVVEVVQPEAAEQKVEPVQAVDPVLVEPTTEEPVVEQQVIFAVEEPVASVPEESIQTIEEASLVSSHSFRERKKSR